jgi:hypothetical protein
MKNYSEDEAELADEKEKKSTARIFIILNIILIGALFFYLIIFGINN